MLKRSGVQSGENDERHCEARQSRGNLVALVAKEMTDSYARISFDGENLCVGQEKGLFSGRGVLFMSAGQE